MQFEINTDNVKALSWSVKNYLAGKGHTVPNMLLQEAISQGFGLSNFNTVRATTSGGAQKLHAPLVGEVGGGLQAWFKGDEYVEVRFDTYVTEDYAANEYPRLATYRLTQRELEGLMAAHAQLLATDRYETVLEMGPELRWDNEDEFLVASSEMVLTRQGVTFRMTADGVAGQVETTEWPIDVIETELRLRVPGCGINAGELTREEPQLTSANRKLAGDYLHGDKKVSVFLVMSRTIDWSRPRYARMVLTEETLGRMLNVMALMEESGQDCPLSFSKGFVVEWVDDDGKLVLLDWMEMTRSTFMFSKSGPGCTSLGYIETEQCAYSQLLAGLLERQPDENLYQRGDGSLDPTYRYVKGVVRDQDFGGSSSRKVSFVLDRNEQRIIEMRVNGASASEVDVADFEERLLNANGELLDELAHNKATVVAGCSLHSFRPVLAERGMDARVALDMMVLSLKAVFEEAMTGKATYDEVRRARLATAAYIAVSQYDPDQPEPAAPSGDGELDAALRVAALAMKDLSNAAENGEPYSADELKGGAFQEAQELVRRYDRGELFGMEQEAPVERVLEAGDTLYEYLAKYPGQFPLLEGRRFRITRAITEPDEQHPAAVLPMYEVEFDSGVKINVYPEEIVVPNAR